MFTRRKFIQTTPCTMAAGLPWSGEAQPATYDRIIDVFNPNNLAFRKPARTTSAPLSTKSDVAGDTSTRTTRDIVMRPKRIFCRAPSLYSAPSQTRIN